MGRLTDRLRGAWDPEKIRSALKDINGRDTAIFLTSLLLAFSIWLIHNLSLYYNEVVSVPVRAVCNLEGHSLVSSNDAVVQARMRLTGFDVLRSRRAASRKPVEVEFAPADMHFKGGEFFYLTATDLNRYVQAVFGDNARLETMISDSVFFRFPLENSRKVPVVPVCSVDFAPQYTAMGDLRVIPDSVTVYGEPSHLEKVDRILTRPFSLSGLRVSAHGRVRLEDAGALRLSENAVTYTLDVSRYVEIRADLPVEGRNVPAGRNLLIYPSVATVLFKCAFPVSVDPAEEGVSLYVDYRDFAQSLGGKCLPRIDALPPGVLDYTVEPQVFDCVESVR